MISIIPNIRDALALFRKTVKILTFVRTYVEDDATSKWARIGTKMEQGQWVNLDDELQISVDNVPVYRASAALLIQDMLLEANYSTEAPNTNILYLCQNTPNLATPTKADTNVWGILTHTYFQEHGNLYRYAFSRIQPQALSLFDDLS